MKPPMLTVASNRRDAILRAQLGMIKGMVDGMAIKQDMQGREYIEVPRVSDGKVIREYLTEREGKRWSDISAGYSGLTAGEREAAREEARPAEMEYAKEVKKTNDRLRRAQRRREGNPIVERSYSERKATKLAKELKG
jgi:hypothetical protein